MWTLSRYISCTSELVYMDLCFTLCTSCDITPVLCVHDVWASSTCGVTIQLTQIPGVECLQCQTPFWGWWHLCWVPDLVTYMEDSVLYCFTWQSWPRHPPLSTILCWFTHTPDLNTSSSNRTKTSKTCDFQNMYPIKLLGFCCTNWTVMSWDQWVMLRGREKEMFIGHS